VDELSNDAVKISLSMKLFHIHHHWPRFSRPEFLDTLDIGL
jgi:hypothetical protein